MPKPDEWNHSVFATPEDFEQQLRVVQRQELFEGEEGWYYLSFVDTAVAASIPENEQVPGGRSWLGGCFVRAWGVATAAMTATLLGINPGGEVACLGPGPKPRDGYENRLLTRQEVEEAVL